MILQAPSHTALSLFPSKTIPVPKPNAAPWGLLRNRDAAIGVNLSPSWMLEGRVPIRKVSGDMHTSPNLARPRPFNRPQFVYFVAPPTPRLLQTATYGRTLTQLPFPAHLSSLKFATDSTTHYEHVVLHIQSHDAPKPFSRGKRLRP
jgi:hypothetical protein